MEGRDAIIDLYTAITGAEVIIGFFERIPKSQAKSQAHTEALKHRHTMKVQESINDIYA